MAEEKKKEEGKKKLVKGRHKSAIKRHRQSLKRAERKSYATSSLRTAMKRVRQAVVAKDAEKSKALLREAVSQLQRAASKGILHHKNASRKIARLSTFVAHGQQ